MKIFLFAAVCVLTPAMAAQQPQPGKPPTPAQNKQAHTEDPGERAFKANCSRCHSVPEQISPSIAPTVLRHMRVRASLSAADEKAILRYFAP